MDKALKQRLVGASVLVALAVVVLPMLLSGQPETQQDTRPIALPPRPSELSFETRRFPIGEQDAAKPSVVEPPAPQGAVAGTQASQTSEPDDPPGSADTAHGKAIDNTDNTADPGTTAPAEQPAEETGKPAVVAAPPERDTGRYLVQVASFSSVSNANRLGGRLQEDGMPVVMDNIETVAGSLHRVRVGPFDTSEDADRAISSIRARMPDLKPRVLDLRPEEAAPVTTPSDPLVRWVVQVGSFAEVANAENLVYRLRDAGYRASSVTVSNANSTVYKVTVGPEIERRNAVQLAESIRRELGLDGLVISTD